MGIPMRDRSVTYRRILDAAYTLFYRNGFARVNVDQIAEQADVTKRTLYDHFRSKDELLTAVLELQHGLALARFEKWGARSAPTLSEMVEGIFGDLARWAATPRWAAPGFTRFVMELADQPGHPARAIASRHKAALETWFAEEFDRRKVKSPNERAREMALLIEGTVTLMLVHGSRDYATAASNAAKRLLCGERSPRARKSKTSNSALAIDSIAAGKDARSLGT
jgi:AcrR family transcriptional regulator